MKNSFFYGMKTVQKIAIEAVEDSHEFLRENMSEIDLEKKIFDLMQSKGVDKQWYPILIYFSHRTVNASKKSLPSNIKLKRRDLISIGVHPTKDRYMGDYSIATIFGENPELQELVDNAKEIQEKTINFATAKTTGSELFEHSLKLMEEFGYKLLDLRGNIGHNIGRIPEDRSKFERKFLNRENNERLGGEFWTIEPFMGNKDFGAVFEDMVFIGDSKKNAIKII